MGAHFTPPPDAATDANPSAKPLVLLAVDVGGHRRGSEACGCGHSAQRRSRDRLCEAGARGIVAINDYQKLCN